MLSLSLDLPILDTSYKWNQQCVATCDWFLSLSIMFMRFIYVVAVSVLHSFFKKNYYLFYLFLAALGLSCGTRDLLLWHVGFSLVVACSLQGTWAL